MRKIVARQEKPLQIVKRPAEELERVVEPLEIAAFASPKCKGCHGAGTYVTLSKCRDGQEIRTANACGCARGPFIAERYNEIAYNPDEPGIPVRWRKGCDPRAPTDQVVEEKPAAGPNDLPPGYAPPAG